MYRAMRRRTLYLFDVSPALPISQHWMPRALTLALRERERATIADVGCRRKQRCGPVILNAREGWTLMYSPCFVDLLCCCFLQKNRDLYKPFACFSRSFMLQTPFLRYLPFLWTLYLSTLALTFIKRTCTQMVSC